ncbi:MAG: oxalate oxidoreductase subunit delta [Ignavibacteriales bacterium]
MQDATELFREKTLRQMSIWTRGVLMNKEARDVAVALANAAAREGKYVQAFDNYVDLPDRVHVPVRSYARISDEPIESKYVYENDRPDCVVLVEETLVKGCPILKGMPAGGTLVVNTKRSPEYIAKFLPDTTNLSRIACVDASGLAQVVITLSGAEGATDASGIGGGVAAPLAGAVARTTGWASLDSLCKVVKDPKAATLGYNSVEIWDVPA